MNINGNNKKVIVTGSNGQTGSYMVDFLLKNTNHNIIGTVRRTSQLINSNLSGALKHPRFKLFQLQLTDSISIQNLIEQEKPDYFLNFGAQTFVADSWKNPTEHFQTNAISLLYILESIRKNAPNCRIYSCGSSEQFGNIKYSPQDELHFFSPRSIYGASKCAASHICKVYRESFNIYVVHGILFNHESIRRQEYFVTRKITKGVARVYKSITSPFGEVVPLELGNLDALRDWSDAEDMVDAIWKMVNNTTPVEYVVASGEAHSIREFVELAFEGVGIKGKWEGSGLNEIYRYVDGPVSPEKIEGTLVRVNSSFYRPAEVKELRGNSNKIRKELGWQPKTDFKHLVAKMVAHDMEEAGLGGDFYRMHVNSPGAK